MGQIPISLRKLQRQPKPCTGRERIPNPPLEHRRIRRQRSNGAVTSIHIKTTGNIHLIGCLQQTPTGQETLFQALVLLIDQRCRG